MSAKGCSPDNAAAEGFFGRPRQEFFHKRSFAGVSMDGFIDMLNDYMVWYRDRRIKTESGHGHHGSSTRARSCGMIGGDGINDESNKTAPAPLETFGLLFESMCVRDFRVYADALDGDVFHFRDRTGLECDAVLHLRDGRYGLIEVKLGGNRLIEEGAANLIKLADKIDTTTMSKPSFLMVATGTGEYSFTRRDGVMVAPIRTLRP